MTPVLDPHDVVPFGAKRVADMAPEFAKLRCVSIRSATAVDVVQPTCSQLLADTVYLFVFNRKGRPQTFIAEAKSVWFMVPAWVWGGFPRG